MSYIIPIDDMAFQVSAGLRASYVEIGKAELAKKLAMSPSQIYERPPDYPNDFVPAATRAGLAGWLTMPLAAVATAYSVFADNVPAALTPQVPQSTAWVFWGIHILTLNDPITQLFFGIGNANNRKAQFDLEPLYSKMTTHGYFNEPVVFYPNDIVNCTVRARAVTNVACRVVLDAFVFETAQTSLV